MILQIGTKTILIVLKKGLRSNPPKSIILNYLPLRPKNLKTVKYNPHNSYMFDGKFTVNCVVNWSFIWSGHREQMTSFIACGMAVARQLPHCGRRENHLWQCVHIAGSEHWRYPQMVFGNAIENPTEAEFQWEKSMEPEWGILSDFPLVL